MGANVAYSYNGLYLPRTWMRNKSRRIFFNHHFARVFLYWVCSYPSRKVGLSPDIRNTFKRLMGLTHLLIRQRPGDESGSPSSCKLLLQSKQWAVLCVSVCTVAAAAALVLTWLQNPGSVREERRESRPDPGSVHSPLFLPGSVPLDDIGALSHVAGRQPEARGRQRAIITIRRDGDIGSCLRREGAENAGRTYRCYPQQKIFYCNLSWTERASKASGKLEWIVLVFFFKNAPVRRAAKLSWIISVRRSRDRVVIYMATQPWGQWKCLGFICQ